jgi:hypothetical protein
MNAFSKASTRPELGERRRRLSRGAVVDERDGEWEGNCDRVRDLQEGPLEVVGHPPRGIGQRDVSDQHVAELPDEEEDRERERVVAVPELAGEEREARRHHQRAEPVVRPSEPRDEPRCEERPRGDNGGDCTKRRRERFREVVDLNLIGDDA